MKTDSQLQKDVMAELEWEPRVDHANIGVAVQDGIVTLSGFVNSYASKLAAEQATRSVKGVRGLAEEIEVRFPSDAKSADPEIAKRIADMFDWSVNVPKDKISVKVEHGWVTLSGQVGYHYHRESPRNPGVADQWREGRNKPHRGEESAIVVRCPRTHCRCVEALGRHRCEHHHRGDRRRYRKARRQGACWL